MTYLKTKKCKKCNKIGKVRRIYKGYACDYCQNYFKGFTLSNKDLRFNNGFTLKAEGIGCLGTKTPSKKLEVTETKQITKKQ